MKKYKSILNKEAEERQQKLHKLLKHKGMDQSGRIELDGTWYKYSEKSGYWYPASRVQRTNREKRKLIRAYDACLTSLNRMDLLRQNGLCYSTIAAWRKKLSFHADYSVNGNGPATRTKTWTKAKVKTKTKRSSNIRSLKTGNLSNSLLAFAAKVESLEVEVLKLREENIRLAASEKKYSEVAKLLEKLH